MMLMRLNLRAVDLGKCDWESTFAHICYRLSRFIQNTLNTMKNIKSRNNSSISVRYKSFISTRCADAIRRVSVAVLGVAIGSAIPLGAEEIPADNAVERSVEMFGSFDPVVLDGDKRSTLITTNWELDLTNNDGDQNQMSMVKCGNYIYVGISYQSPMQGELVVRRYDATMGQHTVSDDFVVSGLPSHDGAGYHTLASDDDGNLLVCRIVRGSTSDSVDLYRIDTDTFTRDEQCDITFYLPSGDFTHTSYQPGLERINNFSGSITSGNFSFDALCAFSPKGAEYTYTYYHFSCENGTPRTNAVFSLPPSFIRATYLNDNYHVDVAPLPGIDHSFVVTHGYSNPDLTHFAPQIITGIPASPEVFTQSITATWDATHNGIENCRGFHAFEHNGHIMGLFPAVSANGSFAFQLISWPEADKGDFLTINPVAKLPAENSFAAESAGARIYPRFYRHLAIAEKPALPSTYAANAATEASTKLFVCSPGRGLASYTLLTQSSTTGAAQTCIGTQNDSPTLSLHDTAIHLTNTNAAYIGNLTIHDLSGRAILTCPVSTESVTLSVATLSPGIYLATCGTSTLRFSIR